MFIDQINKILTLSLYGGEFLNENGLARLVPLWQDLQSSWAELGFFSPLTLSHLKWMLVLSLGINQFYFTGFISIPRSKQIETEG